MSNWTRYTERETGRIGLVDLDKIVAFEQVLLYESTRLNAKVTGAFTRLFSGAVITAGDGDHGSWYIDADEPAEYFGAHALGQGSLIDLPRLMTDLASRARADNIEGGGQ